MGRTFRIKLHFRRFARRHPWLVFAVRSFMVFSATFGGAYGFIAGARTENSGYDPHTFAIGIAFLFALACVGACRHELPLPHAAQEDAQDRHAQRSDGRPELGIAGGRAAHPPPVRVAGRPDRAARCRRPHHLRQRRLLRTGADASRRADRQHRQAHGDRTGRHRAGIERHADSRPEDRRPARPALDRLARRAGPQRRRRAGRAAMRRPRRHRSHRKRTRAGAKPATRPMRRAAPSRASSRWQATRSARR